MGIFVADDYIYMFKLVIRDSGYIYVVIYLKENKLVNYFLIITKVCRDLGETYAEVSAILCMLTLNIFISGSTAIYIYSTIM